LLYLVAFSSREPVSTSLENALTPEAQMWYFSWILGVGFACAFAILNAMWLELNLLDQADGQRR
jgi:cytochrome bd-I ubiquinol oxidase subunit X